jgi:hypothetical protein
MKMLATFLLGLAMVANAVNAQNCASVENNIDYFASGAYDIGFLYNITTSCDCCYQCYLNPSCNYWTHVPQVNVCYLKRDLGIRLYSLGSKLRKKNQALK